MVEETFGRYRLRGLLGAGGMGQVYRAYDTELHRDVAIKVLSMQSSADAEFEQRFRREARVAASLGEPHVVPIYDSGEIDGRLFISMQLIDGTDVATLLSGGPMEPAQAVSIVEQAAAALDAAHEAGLVHRDVKPANLLVTQKNFLYLIDFGIANAAGQTKLTSTGSTIGTLAYMAPERFTAGTVDARADIYALACVLYECLTGATPYPAHSVEQQMFAHVNGPPPQPSAALPGVPVEFDDVIARGMARDPDHRYQSAGELAAAARSALAAVPPTPSPETRLAPQFSPPPPPPPIAAPTRPPRPMTRSRRRTLIAVAVVAVVSLIAGGVGYGFYRHREIGLPYTAVADATIKVPDVGVRNLAVDSANRMLYAHSYPGTLVSVIDMSTNGIARTINGSSATVASAVDPVRGRMYQLARQGDVAVIDLRGDVVSTTINIPAGSIGSDLFNTADIALDLPHHKLYVAHTTRYADGRRENVTVIDTDTDRISGAVDAGSAYSDADNIVVDPNTQTAYAAVNFNQVMTIDTATNTSKGSRDVFPSGTGSIAGLAVDGAGRLIVLASPFGGHNGSLKTITESAQSSFDLPAAGGALALDPTTNTAYVSLYRHTEDVEDTYGVVAVVDLDTNTIVETVKVGRDAGSIAVDTETHTAYVNSGKDHTISVIKPKT